MRKHTNQWTEQMVKLERDQEKRERQNEGEDKERRKNRNEWKSRWKRKMKEKDGKEGETETERRNAERIIPAKNPYSIAGKSIRDFAEESITKEFCKCTSGTSNNQA